MHLIDTLQLSARAAAGLGSMARDAIGDWVGDSMPYRPAEMIAPDILSMMIERHAVAPFPHAPRIKTARRQDIPSVSSNCQCLLLSLEEDGESLLPASVFLKLPMESFAIRWFFSIIGSWRLEAHFSAHVAPSLPIRTPLTYAAAANRTRFFLVQENLREDPTVALFTNFDMLEGPSLEIVHRCLDTFARLHAVHVDLDRAQQDAILPMDLHLFLSPTLGVVSRNLNRLALAPCMKKQPGEIPPEVAAAYRDTVEHWDELLEFWFSGPLSLLHGDSHLGNFFSTGDDMGMLDWQAAHWGKGIRDVQYFLIDSLPAATLADHEQDLVAYYVSRRAAHGAPIDPSVSWEEYRSFTFHTLMTIIVSIGFGGLNQEQDSLMTEILRRAVAAVERADYPQWLGDFLASR